MRQEALARAKDSLRTVQGRTGLAGDRALPLVAGLASLFPEGGLRRGSTVSLGMGPSVANRSTAASGPSAASRSTVGVTSLALALLGGPSAGGTWCAVVGVADLGLVAAAQAGVDLGRLALVPSPGPRWATVVATLLEGFEVVVLRPPLRPRQVEASNLEARSRESGAALIVLACPGWPGRPDLRLEVVGGSWRGLGDGFGYLAGREIEVVATGRGSASKLRRGRISLGEPAGLLQARPAGPAHAGPAHAGPASQGHGHLQPGERVSVAGVGPEALWPGPEVPQPVPASPLRAERVQVLPHPA